MHTSEKRWGDTSEQVSAAAHNLRDHLQMGEEVYRELLELWAYAGSTAQGLADQLFVNDWFMRISDPIGAPLIVDTGANVAEVAKAQDLINSITSIHELYDAANNQPCTTSDRFAELRRMI